MGKINIKHIFKNDKLTLNHCIRVSEIAKEFGIFLKLTLNEINILKNGGLYHDIGKSKIPINILHKKNINSLEFQIIKNHTVLGHQLLKNNKINEEYVDIALFHHERIDGKGYPIGLKKDEISNFCKIISLCDSFDAITSKRAYKEALSISYAIDEIEKNLGTQFDVEFGNMFLRFINKSYVDYKHRILC